MTIVENINSLKCKNIIILENHNIDKTLILKYFNNQKFNYENINFKVFNYQKIIIDGEKNYLFNSPENSDFMSLVQVRDEKVDGIIIIIDTTHGLDTTYLEIMDLIADMNVPHVLLADRDDLNPDGMNILMEGVLVIPTIIKEGIGVDSGLKMLLKLIDMPENKPTPHSSENQVYDSEFSKLRLFFHPIELERVKKSLEQFGFSNMTIVDIKYQDPLIEKTETYRCSSYEVQLPPKTEMIMIIKKEDIKYVVQAIEAVKTNDVSEKIFVSPVEDVIRIRTTERGENAID